jgi:hypothetical protein
MLQENHFNFGNFIKKVAVFLIILCISLSLMIILQPLSAQASTSVVINEIMFDLKEGGDTGREWVETYNAGDTAVDVTTLKFFEGNTNHSIKFIKGDQSIPASGYAVIADDSNKFLVDNPTFSGNLFDSTFSFSNDGETVSIKDSTGVVLDALSFAPTQGGAGDGSTLGKLSGVFTSTDPTPGKANVVFVAPPVDMSGESASSTAPNTSTSSGVTSAVSTSISSHSESSSVFSIKENPIFKVEAGRDRLTLVRTPVLFSARSVDADGGDASGIYFSWSFGDGTQGYGKSISHSYEFAGDYNVTLTGSNGGGAFSGATVVSRAKVFVRDSALSIRDVFVDKQGFVEIYNAAKEEANIGGWFIGGGDLPDGSIQKIQISNNTIIGSKKSIHIPFSFLSSPPTVSLLYPSGEVATSSVQFKKSKSFLIYEIEQKILAIQKILNSK